MDNEINSITFTFEASLPVDVLIEIIHYLLGKYYGTNFTYYKTNMLVHILIISLLIFAQVKRSL